MPKTLPKNRCRNLHQKKHAPKAEAPKNPKTGAAEALPDITLKDDCLLGTAKAAALVGLAPKSLRQMRCERTGPRCLKLGSGKQARVVYRRSDLEAWVRSSVVTVMGS